MQSTSPPPLRPETPGAPRRPSFLAFLAPCPKPLLYVGLAMLAVRVAWVLALPELDSDAYGHFGIAIAVRRDPTDLGLHWVWLPLYHYVVGALTAVGLTLRGLRIINALLATITPFLLYDFVRRRVGEDDALIAGVALTIASIPTLMGVSGQPETAFALFVVASVAELARERPVRAGVYLSVACFLRYEAWGAALALSIAWLVAKLRRRIGPPFAAAAIPAALIAAYVLFRWWTDGHFLLFLHRTRDFSRAMVAREAWTLREILIFPVIKPVITTGPAIALAPLGLRRALGTDWEIPAGCAGFLLLSYYAGGSHAGDRYLTSLVPFLCAAIGAGAVRLGRRIGRPRAVAAVTLLALALGLGYHLRRSALMAIAWGPDLRAREAEIGGPRRPALARR